MAEQKKNGKTKRGCAADVDVISAQEAGRGVEQDPADLENPDANVDPDGHCIVPTFAETARIDTGDPCFDGLNWPGAGDDVPVSPHDGAIEKKGGKNGKKS